MVTEGFKQCPHCAEEILLEAKKCKHCGEFLIGSKENKVATPGNIFNAPQGENKRETLGGQASDVAKTAAAVGIGGCLTPIFFIGAIIIVCVIFMGSMKHC